MLVLALPPACCVVLGLGKPQPLSHKLPMYKKRTIIFACFAGVNTLVLMFLQDSEKLKSCQSVKSFYQAKHLSLNLECNLLQ